MVSLVLAFLALGSSCLRMPLDFCSVFFSDDLSCSTQPLANENPWIFTHWLTTISRSRPALSASQSALMIDQNCTSSLLTTAYLTSSPSLGTLSLVRWFRTSCSMEKCLESQIIDACQPAMVDKIHPCFRVVRVFIAIQGGLVGTVWDLCSTDAWILTASSWVL